MEEDKIRYPKKQSFVKWFIIFNSALIAVILFDFYINISMQDSWRHNEIILQCKTRFIYFFYFNIPFLFLYSFFCFKKRKKNRGVKTLLTALLLSCFLFLRFFIGCATLDYKNEDPTTCLSFMNNPVAGKLISINKTHYETSLYYYCANFNPSKEECPNEFCFLEETPCFDTVGSEHGCGFMSICVSKKIKWKF